MGQVGSRLGRKLARIVHTIGQKDDHLALAVAVLQMAHGVGQAHANGCTWRDNARTGQVAVDMLEETEQGGVVRCHGALHEGFSAKEHETDIVVRPILHELDGHIARSYDAVGMDVGRQHTGGNIHREDNVNTFHLPFA